MKLFKIRRSGENKESDLKKDDELNIMPLAKDRLGISKKAALHIKFLMAQKNDQDQYLRVAIRGGGCSGLSLHYEFCHALGARDLVFEEEGVKLAIDQKSLSLLGGSTLHAREYLGSFEFVLVNNPVEKQCSCGKSFSI